VAYFLGPTVQLYYLYISFSSEAQRQRQLALLVPMSIVAETVVSWRSSRCLRRWLMRSATMHWRR